MARVTDELIVRGVDSGASAVLRDVAARAEKLASAAGVSSAQITALASSVSAVTGAFSGVSQIAGLAQRAIGGVVDGVRALIAAGNESERATVALGTALELRVENFQSVQASLDRYATRLQNVTGIGDEATKQAQAYGLALGIPAARLDEATRAAAGFAAVTGSDLQSAMSQVARAFAGHVEILRRYGLEVKDGEDALRKLGEFFVFAERQGATFDGRVKALEQTVGDVVEEIGTWIVKNDSLIQSLDGAVTATLGLLSIVQNAPDQWRAFSSAVEKAQTKVEEFVPMVGILRSVFGDNAFASGLRSVVSTLNDLNPTRILLGLPALEKAYEFFIATGADAKKHLQAQAYLQAAGIDGAEAVAKANADAALVVSEAEKQRILDSTKASFKVVADHVAANRRIDEDAERSAKRLREIREKAGRETGDAAIAEFHRQQKLEEAAKIEKLQEGPEGGSKAVLAFQRGEEEKQRAVDRLAKERERRAKAQQREADRKLQDEQDKAIGYARLVGGPLAEMFNAAIFNAENFGEVVASMLQRLAAQLISSGIISLFASLFSGGTLSVAGAFSKILGFRNGGVVHARTGFAIPGYGGGDRVPIMAERGELVVRKELAPAAMAAGFGPGGSGSGGGSIVINAPMPLLGGLPTSAQAQNHMRRVVKPALERASGGRKAFRRQV